MEEDVPQPSTVPQVEDMEATHMRNDSLVTVRLSETPTLKIDTNFESEEKQSADQPKTLEVDLSEEADYTIPESAEVGEGKSPPLSRRLSMGKPEVHNLTAELATFESKRTSDISSISNISTIRPEPRTIIPNLDKEILAAADSRHGSRSSSLSMNEDEEPSMDAKIVSEGITMIESRRGSNDTEDSGEVNWDRLEKNEADEPKDEESDNSTALLLARLEQENNSLATNPKSAISKPPSAFRSRPRGQSRPPSMHQLKRMVNRQSNMPDLRFSLVPPPPMTDMEFWTALARDYPETVSKLPTLVSKKIRMGVPHPIRGVVWQSMAGSRDRALEEQYERLSGNSTPYEGIIDKDLGRSFPGVEMFRDPDGEGQRQLGRVLKCFSLYDQKIGYCQGLGFLVGPLLMTMPDKEAFCILVKLMEQYDLRSCYLPDLSGLHVRIFQFRSLLQQHLPNIASHLDDLQINGLDVSYISQWFLSFFAVTCPLPMLFRIFDVIFAEGASITLMRVALSLMRKNEAKILAATELEDVMHLLLSRGIWDCYHSNADELVSDFVSFSGIVTLDTLQKLATAHQFTCPEVRTNTDVGSVTAFLGRLWTGQPQVKSVGIPSPSLSAPTGPRSFLRRSTSKQSIASTLNSMEGISDGSYDVAVSRDSSNTENSSSTRAQSLALGHNRRKTGMSTMSKQDSELHGQIEDLLTAMSEMNRVNAELKTRLQREEELRAEDKATVQALIEGLKRKSRMEAFATIAQGDTNHTNSNTGTDVKDFAVSKVEYLDPSSHITVEELSSLLDAVEDRFDGVQAQNRRSSVLQSKGQLRDELARSKEQLENEVSKSQDLARRLETEESIVVKLREQVRESHAHSRNAHAEKQRLERQVNELKNTVRNRDKSPVTSPDGSDGGEGTWSASGRSSTWSGGSAGGLRELKLGRTDSSKSHKAAFSKRTSSLQNPLAHVTAERREYEHVNTSSVSSLETAASSPPPTNIADNEALILELVEAKTAKVVAEQEVEDLKQKLDTLKKMMSKNGDRKSSPSVEKPVAQGGFMSYMSRTASIASVEAKPSVSNPTIVATPPKESTPESKPAAVAAVTATALGAFWGGWGKK